MFCIPNKMRGSQLSTLVALSRLICQYWYTPDRCHPDPTQLWELWLWVGNCILELCTPIHFLLIAIPNILQVYPHVHLCSETTKQPHLFGKHFFLLSRAAPRSGLLHPPLFFCVCLRRSSCFFCKRLSSTLGFLFIWSCTAAGPWKWIMDI